MRHVENSPTSSAEVASPLSAEDIEAAYERALSAMESVELAVEHLQVDVSSEAGDANDCTSGVASLSGVSTNDTANTQTCSDLNAHEIVEAALFVGGTPFTTKRLSQMLGGSETADRVEAYIAQLNRTYDEESRPYEIDFGEGGYRLVLRSEFESVRDSVFGAGPKDVKLSQDALEVLAFVAYRQPTTREALEEAGKERAATLLRQLLRRELLTLTRTDEGDVVYETTARFLEVFGLRTIDDLPFPEDLVLK